ncbi:MAG TPA: hypothetical protein PK783_08790 [Chitinophagales bacterium]|nr:hypothetical protein [Chitinophagales bacterium]
MRKLILKLCFFVLPFFIIYFININFYIQKEGDLVRLGYFYKDALPKSKLDENFSDKIKYKLVSKINLKKKEKYDIFVIGDSFSNQNNRGYVNFLAERGLSVLYMDKFISDKENRNPIQKLIELINSDFFDYVQPKYIILQSVGRVLVQRFKNIDLEKSLTMNDLQSVINNYKVMSIEKKIGFFSNAIYKIPVCNIQYKLGFSKPTFSQTYKVELSQNNLFSLGISEFLFLDEELTSIKLKNNKSMIDSSNYILNIINSKLSEKNIQLIFLGAPDKYDLYYSYIKNKNNFEQPILFEYFSSLEKQYIYVDAYNILKERLNDTKDIYYYDDTHWSPIGAKLIADEIQNKINN